MELGPAEGELNYAGEELGSFVAAPGCTVEALDCTAGVLDGTMEVLDPLDV